MPETEEKPKKASGAEKRKRRREALAQAAGSAPVAAPGKVAPIPWADMVDTPKKPSEADSKKPSGAEKRKRRRDTLAEEAAGTATASKESTAPQQASPGVQKAGAHQADQKLEDMKFGKLVRLAKEEHGITDEQLDDMEQADLITWLRAQQPQLPPLEDMKFGKLVRLAKEEHGITDEQLDDMEQADLITWLRAQQKGAPTATASNATVPASTDANDNKKRKLSGAEKRKQKKDENTVRKLYSIIIGLTTKSIVPDTDCSSTKGLPLWATSGMCSTKIPVCALNFSLHTARVSFCT